MASVAGHSPTVNIVNLNPLHLFRDQVQRTTFEVVELNGFLGLYFLLSEAVTDALGDGLRRSNGHFGQMVVYEVWKAGD
jgi:hypothetical protein